jgi:tetratricopeptide (TPR) repeat protein
MLKRWAIIGFCLVFAFALSVRLFYLHESSKSITFENPILDAATYHDKAIVLARDGAMDSEFFWQQFFYPFYLSGVYYCFGSSIAVAKIIQAILGAVTCGLTFLLGKRLFNFTTGIIAAGLTAAYGPLVFQEAELIAAGFTAFWAVLLLLLFLKAKDKPSFKLLFILGIIGALSTITRPNFLLFFSAATIWLVVSRAVIGRQEVKLLPAKILVIALGFVVGVAPVSYLNYRINGNLSFLPASGGINLYIGNNPDFDAAELRPGYKWEHIISIPIEHGYKEDIWEKQEFFYKETKRFFVSDPVRFVKGLLSKTMQLLSSREMPGNVDVYLFRDSSKLLSCLMWKYRKFGFPFGVLLPLAVFGFCVSWRKVSIPFLLFIAFYSLPLIFAHIEARYRMALIPLLAIAAAGGICGLGRMMIGRRWMPLAGSIVLMSVVVFGSTVPGPFVSETQDYLPELHLRVGVSLKDKGKPSEAMEHYDRAIKLNPEYSEAYYSKGAMLYFDGKIEEAIINFEKALELEPKDFRVYNNLGSAYGRSGYFEKAVFCFRETLKIKQNDYEAFMNLANTYIIMKQYHKAAEVYQEALKYHPDDITFNGNLAKLKMYLDHKDQATQDN